MQKNSLLLSSAIFVILGIIGIGTITLFFTWENSDGWASPTTGNIVEQTKENMHRTEPNFFSLGSKLKNAPDRNSQGGKLFARYCKECHTLPSPLAHNAEEWPMVANRMFRMMDDMAGHTRNIAIPPLADQEEIIEYLKAQSSRPLSSETGRS